MFYLSETSKKYYRYFSLLAVVILGVVSILGSGGGGDSTPPPPPPAPSVLDVTPSQSSDTALVTTEVLARFSESMDSSTINTNSFLLSDSGSNPITGSVDFYAQYDGQDNVAVFVPDNDLDVAGEYFATITADAKDTSGEPIARDYVWSFSIAPALVPVSTNSTDSFVSRGADLSVLPGPTNITSDPSASDATSEYVVITSRATLVAGVNTGGIAQIYRKNTLTGHVEFVSLNSNNQFADADCFTPRISNTGRFVVFASKARNLDLTITQPDGLSHIYLKDMKVGTLTLLDRHPTDNSKHGNRPSFMPDISGIPKDDPQGKFVIFESEASDLVDGDSDTNGLSDIFFVNPAGTIERISVSLDPADNYRADGPSYRPRVSNDGRRIVFESDATNLIENGTNGQVDDTNGQRDIFLRNRSTDITTRLSVASNGTQATGGVDGSINADISADGQFAVFQSDQPNLDSANDTNGTITDVFLRDINTPATTIMSVAENGSVPPADGDAASTLPSISGDGRYIAFESLATTLLGEDNDSNTKSDIFVRDKDSNTIRRVSVDNNNAQASDHSIHAAISPNGRYVCFTSPYAFDLSDGNTVFDIYRAYNSAYQ